MPQYEHTQEGPVHLILYGLAAIFIGIAWFSSGRGMPYVGMLALAGLMIFLALCFQRLTVRDEGEWLGTLGLVGWRRHPLHSRTRLDL